LRTRASEAYVVCEGMNGVNRPPLPVYVTNGASHKENSAMLILKA
jgi:hypothetical protein